jgi:hypothetical protein
MTESKTFLLGVGAQKAGTTWLYNYLTSSPNVARTPMKEYHVWDGLYLPSCKRFAESENNIENSVENLRSELQKTPSLYFSHFHNLLDHPSKNVTCDITPSYAGLKNDVYNYIKTQFSERGISAKAIFLMRDPVERCWSASRMKLRETIGHTDVSSEVVLSAINSEGHQIRTRYDLTVAELEAAFEPQSLFIGLYEKIQDVDQLRSMSNFCQVELRPELTNLKFNVSSKVSPLDVNVAQKIVKHHKSVYEFAARRFPEVVNLWGGYRYL